MKASRPRTIRYGSSLLGEVLVDLGLDVARQTRPAQPPEAAEHAVDERREDRPGLLGGDVLADVAETPVAGALEVLD